MTSEQKKQIRAHVKTAYDFQDFRMRVGGRLVQNFRSKLGLDESDDDDEDVDVLRTLKTRYERITDGIAADKISRRRSFDYDGVITDYGELLLISHYMRLTKQEKRLFYDLKAEIEEIDVWQEFFADVKGIGPAMAGVMLSEFDPHAGKYVSSFWAYAGLDTVATWIKEIDHGEVVNTWEEPPKSATYNASRDRARVEHDDGTQSVWGKEDRARSRRSQHLVEKEYTDAEGNEKTRKGLSFNPFLHDKLLGVCSECLVRANGHYKSIYDDYKKRITADGKGSSDGHRDRMAKRYMIQRLVADLYEAWRPLEGLPVHDPWAEDKLENEPHGDS